MAACLMTSELDLPNLDSSPMSKLHLCLGIVLSVISGFILSHLTGLLPSALAYCNSRFCLLKFTKPVDERDLQALATPSQTSLFVSGLYFRRNKLLYTNTDGIIYKLVMVFAGCCTHDKFLMVLAPGHAHLLAN